MERKNSKKFVLIKCIECGVETKKALKEIARQVKNGRDPSRFFCSLSCGSKFSNKEKPRPGNVDNLIFGSEPDEFSPFRRFVAKAKSRQRKSRYGEANIDWVYLKQVWEDQKGICPYSGFLMQLPQNTGHFIPDDPLKASLDRIDSSKGYVKGNVEFVCLFVNYAKNGFSKELMTNLFEPIKQKNSASIAQYLVQPSH